MNKIIETLKRIEAIDHELMEDAQRRLDTLTKPLGSLGRLEELAKKLVGITRQAFPRFHDKLVIVMAADHGVVADGVSAYPKDVTAQMVLNFLRGGAAINVLARHVGARVLVVDMGVAEELAPAPGLVIRKMGLGTRSITKGPAMSRAEAEKSIEAGLEILTSEHEKGADIICTGDMGIGNTTASSAMIAVLTGSTVESVTGRGTGVDDAGLQRKVRAIKQALVCNLPNRNDPIDVLAKVGGYEIGGLVGVMLAGAACKMPVVIDGLITSAAALIAAALEPKAKDYFIAGHCSAEIGHEVALEFMKLQPLLNLEMRLGEGSGAALAMSLIEASTRILAEMATFEQAGVSGKTSP